MAANQDQALYLRKLQDLAMLGSIDFKERVNEEVTSKFGRGFKNKSVGIRV